MTLEEMIERGNTCNFHPLNRQDRIVVEEIWTATIEICKRLEQVSTDKPITEEDIEIYLRGRCRICNELKTDHFYRFGPTSEQDTVLRGYLFCVSVLDHNDIERIFTPYETGETR